MQLDRGTELLEKERAADAALSAIRELDARKAFYDRQNMLEGPTAYRLGYAAAVQDYHQWVLRFAAANPSVAAKVAATDDLPF